MEIQNDQKEKEKKKKILINKSVKQNICEVAYFAEKKRKIRKPIVLLRTEKT